MERRLARGLDALLGRSSDTPKSSSEPAVQVLAVESIRPNPRQPRREFDDGALAELKESIARDGLLQPIVVSRVDGGYELIAGERRWRACKALGLASIPALVRGATPDQQLALALVENLQRANLNPVEEAMAYRRLVVDFNLTHEDVANRMGKDRSTVTNALRLLELPREVLEQVSRGTLSSGHARALMGLRTSKERVTVAQRILDEGLSVRRTEEIVRGIAGGEKSEEAVEPEPVAPPAPSAVVADLERRLRDRWGVRSEVKLRGRGGSIRFHCASRAELDHLLERLTSASDDGTSAEAEFHV